MQGIYWAAVVVTVPVAAVAAVAWQSWGRDRNAVVCFLAGLPLSALVNQYVKTPAILWLGQRPLPSSAGVPWVFLALVLWVAPLAEEAVKLLPLAAPDIRESLRSPSSALKYGMAAGVGFGLGEAWYLAWGIAGTHSYAAIPFYYFTAYMTERLVVTFAHGVMTSVAMSGVAGGRAPAVRGYMSAVVLHALLNLGALLYQFGLASPLVANLGMLAVVVALARVFERMLSRAFIG